MVLSNSCEIDYKSVTIFNELKCIFPFNHNFLNHRTNSPKTTWVTTTKCNGENNDLRMWSVIEGNILLKSHLLLHKDVMRSVLKIGS